MLIYYVEFYSEMAHIEIVRSTSSELVKKTRNSYKQRKQIGILLYNNHCISVKFETIL